MPDAATAARALPGVRFEVPPQTLDGALPRMDVALFVGFAARGPLDVPVAVESLAEFEAVYGTGLVLAREVDTAEPVSPAVPTRDADTGEPVAGLLHPSVRGFFGNGGRRCWIQRVAGDDVRARVFPLPALLLARRLDAAGGWRLSPATLTAASPGSGADGVQVAARVRASLLRARRSASADDTFVLSVAESASTNLRVGDLVRMTLDEVWAHGRIAAVETAPPDAGGRPRRRVVLQGLVALRAPAIGSPALELSGLTLLDLDPAGQPQMSTEVSARGDRLGDGRLAVTCRLAATRLPQPGEVVALRFATVDEAAFMALDEVELVEASDLGGEVELRLTGRPWLDARDAWQTGVAAWGSHGEECVVAVLRLDLRARVDADTDVTVEGLAMATPAQALGLGASVFDLPDDEHLYVPRASAAVAGGTTLAVEQRDERGRLRRRFPLAAAAIDGELTLLPLAELPGFGAGLGPLPDPLTALERDGLTDFSWQLFAEPALAAYSSDAVADRAEALRHAGRDSRPLRGMHVALGGDVDALVDEPTLLAVPDAVHPGWSPIPQPDDAWSELPPLPEPPDPCAGETFVDCDAEPLPSPRFVRGADPLADGRFTLHWTRIADGAEYEVVESTEADFGIATDAYRGEAARHTVLGKRAGTLYYRVRASLGRRRSVWSRPIRIRLGVQGYETRAWRPDELLA
ncbi:MAG TPA: hypothetical protein VGR82_19570, partial [Methylomirabilota bacterium]|nr:hypothetical protein [Methylomirabilota bacterium]